MDGRVNNYTHLRMDKRMRNLQGSELRDVFKRLHKQKLPNWMFGCDVDFALVEKRPYSIVAFVDVKRQGELVTFTEVVAYNELRKTAPVFLAVVMDEDALERGEFRMVRYLGGDPRPNPPDYQVKTVARLASWKEWQDWERELRRNSKR